MFLLIGSVLEAQLEDDISRFKYFALLTDEVCDVSNKEQLVTFVKFVHLETGKVKIAFLAASNPLRIEAQRMLKQYQMLLLHRYRMQGSIKGSLQVFPLMELQY